MWLLEDMKVPTFATIGNFIRENLTETIENIYVSINKVIFEKDNVDLNHTYIDETKIEANANEYTWEWKKSCIKNRDKTFVKVTEIIEKMNNEDLNLLGIKFETRTEYAIEYIEEILKGYKKECCPRTKKDTTIRLNRELTTIHEEVLRNLCSMQGALLCMNRSIQAEGTF